MKTLIILLSFCAGLQTFAAETFVKLESAKENPLVYLQKISEKKLDEKKDIELVKQALQILLKLDETDPSRTGAAILAESFGKNKKLYQKAAKQIETKKNKTSLSEILEMMKTLNENGNG